MAILTMETLPIPLFIKLKLYYNKQGVAVPFMFLALLSRIYIPGEKGRETCRMKRNLLAITV
jgi:hypothetical protein